MGYGLNIVENTIERSAGGEAPSEGIVVGYTNEANEVVFRNEVHDLDLGFVGEGTCADVGGDPLMNGLQFQCNVNENNNVNIKSRIANGDGANAFRHTIRGRQGTTSTGATNTFSGDLHFEVATQCNVLPYVEYSYAANQGPTTYTAYDGNPNNDYLLPTLVNNSIACPTAGPVFVIGGGQTFAEVRPNILTAKTT